MKELILTWIFTFAFIYGVSSISWENCGRSTNPIKVKNLWLTQTGTTLNINAKLKVAQNFTQPIKGEIIIQRLIPFIDKYIKIPCINNVGSCKFDDICKFTAKAKDLVPSDSDDTDLPLSCPITMNNYTIKNFPINLHSVPKEILQGSYKLSIKLSKNIELLCLEVLLKL